MIEELDSVTLRTAAEHSPPSRRLIWFEGTVKPAESYTAFFSLFLVSIFMIFLGLLCSPPRADAQGATKAKHNDVKGDGASFPVQPSQGLHVDVDLAIVNVTVTDPYNRLVAGLDSDNFRVFEDNIEQEVVAFSSEDVPISIGVIFDCSASMRNKIDKAREAVI